MRGCVSGRVRFDEIPTTGGDMRKALLLLWLMIPILVAAYH